MLWRGHRFRPHASRYKIESKNMPYQQHKTATTDTFFSRQIRSLHSSVRPVDLRDDGVYIDLPSIEEIEGALKYDRGRAVEKRWTYTQKKKSCKIHQKNL
jgi:hypothetical protein